MHGRILLATALILLTPGCKKEGLGLPPDTPKCIERMMRGAANATALARVERHRYSGRWTYLMFQTCDDCENLHFDDNCSSICAPSGGFGGAGDGKCSTDLSTTNGEEIWRAE